MILTKTEALEFISERAEIFDLSTNPFSKTAWLLHFVKEVVEPHWKIIAPESFMDGESTMLLVDDGRVRSLTNYYASLYSPVSSTRTSQIPHLIEQLGWCSTINFSPLDSEAESTHELQKALEDHHWYVRRYFSQANWYMPGKPYVEYLGERDSQLRNTIKRKGKSFPGELRIYTEPGEVESAMDAYDLVYSKSWKKPEPYLNFVRGWARICADNGWLRLGIATLNETPIAAHFWFVIDGRASIFKLAYDEAHNKLSAGTLLTSMLMKHVLDVDKVTEVDYLSGDDPYKAAWMSQRRERIGLMACNRRTLMGMGRAFFEYAGSLRRSH